ncbi:MAG: formylglycine-generating enzyme family protein [Rhodospirillaceae bacterium]|nr:formylglycine-generating enzyme family protein [Rhodospirillaceae bacterium]
MKIAKALLLAFFISAPVAAQEQTPDAVADKLLLEASEASENGHRQEALRILQEIEALGVEPAPEFTFVYGMTLAEHGADAKAWRKARSLLTAFIAAAGWESEHYTQALELLLAAQAKLNAAETQDRLEERLPDILEAVRAQMVRVEGGSFAMGCTPEQERCNADELTVRTVQVDAFEIGTYEVTQELWQAVMGENPATFADCPRCPVETVSWNDVQAFLRKLNSAGGGYRLPSEAEWEYASRGGPLSMGYQYAGSDDWTEVAWYYENADNRTHPVGQRKPNELGLFDMSGNVREWVQDCWHDSYAGAPNDGRAWEDGDCVRRVIRGGSWYGKPSYVRSANRFWYATYFRNNNLGFRLALTPGE